ncbi:MAG TPA: thiamine pyrophosphate-dependent enzyme [Micromonosporaceae bacterium]|nr:thiamine pyrophosphate-dependent enzyme [Micromonosporaceae bacterium]
MTSLEPGQQQVAAGSADRSVTEVIVGFLRETLGCDRMFTVPGEAVLPLVSLAGQTGIELVPMRHEAGAGFAAVADAWLTGRPGLVAVNRSPGAANVSIALDATRSDPAPVLVVMGAPRRGQDPRTGYQATSPEAQLGGVAVVVTVEEAGALPKYLAQAAEALGATAAKAVVLVVPQDVWGETVPSSQVGDHAPGRAAAGSFDSAELPGEAERTAAERVRQAFTAARRPAVVAGRILRRGPGGSPSVLLDRLARSAGVPVLLGNKQQDLLHNGLPSYAGDLHQATHPATRARLADADLVVFLGSLPCEVHLARWYSGQPLVTVHPEPAGPGEHLVADPVSVLEILAEAEWTGQPPSRQEWMDGWRALECELSQAAPPVRPDGVDFGHVAIALDRCLPDDAVVALDAGNFGGFVHRYLHIREGQRLLSLADGAMGFGVPGAVAAVRRHPERTVVAVVGDGGLLMTGNELAAARIAGRAPAVIVADNGGYGAIRTQGARTFPGVDCACDLVNPDFVRWAEAFGLEAERVSRVEEVLPAVRRALACRTGYLLHVDTSRVAAHANFDLPTAAAHAPS